MASPPAVFCACKHHTAETAIVNSNDSSGNNNNDNIENENDMIMMLMMMLMMLIIELFPVHNELGTHKTSLARAACLVHPCKAYHVAPNNQCLHGSYLLSMLLRRSPK